MNKNPSVEIVLSLVRSKNKCLENLLEKTKTMLQLTVDQLIKENKLLDEYQNIRETTLKTIDLFDRKMSEHISQLSVEDKSSAFIGEIQAEMIRYEGILMSIFNSDDQVFRKIEEASRIILRQMGETRKAQDTLEKIKSSTGNTTTQADTGTGLDTTL